MDDMADEAWLPSLATAVETRDAARLGYGGLLLIPTATLRRLTEKLHRFCSAGSAS